VSELITLQDVRDAAARIEPFVHRTPLIPTAHSALFLKCESMQPVGAFKQRGAYNMLLQLPSEARARGVIAFSSGNHGNAVAAAARALKIPAIVVMPETAPRVKVQGVRSYGAEVVIAGRTSDERRQVAEALASERQMTLVPPFDHEWIIAGQGTVALEILEQCPKVSAIYVPVGGGGLISGVAAVIKRLRSDVRVIGVEPTGGAKMSESLAAGRPVTLEKTQSIADGLLPLRPGDLTFAHVQALVDDVVTVADEQIAAAVKWIFKNARIVAEPSGAAASAAAFMQMQGDSSGTNVAIVSGGNVAPEDFARYVC
jgi:threonine dehydratase